MTNNETLSTENQRLKEENARLKADNERLMNELIRLIGRNLDLAERLEDDVELRRRAAVAREIMEGNTQRQHNADLQDDGQLLALIELRAEQNWEQVGPEFDAASLAKLLGVSKERLMRLFHRMSLYRTPDAYIDNLRLLKAMRLLREKPNYTIATVAEEAGFNSVRTLQRRMQDAIGMTPVEYRLMF